MNNILVLPMVIPILVGTFLIFLRSLFNSSDGLVLAQWLESIYQSLYFKSNSDGRNITS